MWPQTLRKVDRQRVLVSSPAFLCMLVIPTLEQSERIVRASVGGEEEGNLSSVLACFSNVTYDDVNHLDVVF